MDNKLKQLKTQWYKKLKDSGFDDIEQENGLLKRWSTHEFRSQTPGRYQVIGRDSNDDEADKGYSGYRQPKTNVNLSDYEARQEYFYKAEHFFNTHRFTTAFEKEVWRLHAQGKSLAEIAANIHPTRQMIKRYVTRLQKKFLEEIGVTSKKDES